MRFGAKLQGFNRRILFYLRTLSGPTNFPLRKFDKDLYLMWMQLCRYLEIKALTVLNVCLDTPFNNKRTVWILSFYYYLFAWYCSIVIFSIIISFTGLSEESVSETAIASTVSNPLYTCPNIVYTLPENTDSSSIEPPFCS